MGLLVLIFLVVPVVELAVVVRVADAVGLGDTILLLVAISFVGAWLVKREGTAAWRRAQEAAAAGRVPDRELVDGVMILVGGAFLLTPGFVTDGVGLALLFPPVRAILRAWVGRRIAHRTVRLHVGPVWGGEEGHDGASSGWTVEDVTVIREDRPPNDPTRGPGEGL